MRGKDKFGFGRVGAERITPAYAGKRSPKYQDIVIMQDHPRLCGEKDYGNLKIVILLGSPPPMRGKVCIIGESWNATGITPAYAGKSGNWRCC